MPPTSAAPRRRPNVLVIMSDEHQAAVMGAAGNPLARTPTLDALAAQGVTFDGAYCNSPLCVPSRLSFTAGKYVSRVGGWSNSCWLPSADYPSLPRVLNAAGYRSLLCGKQHYDATHRYGFAEVGGAFNQHYMSGLGKRRDPDDLAPRPGLSERFADFHPGTSVHMAYDQRVTTGAVEFLRRQAGAAQPFFLFVGYLAPHFPLIVPEPYVAPFRGRVPPPVLPPGHLASQPRNYQHLRTGFHMQHVPAELVQRGRELYYGLTWWMDEQVAQVLAALTASGLADDTVVIYTSDHGENLGEHGLWWKNCVYDTAARVPLIVRWPGRWAGGQRRRGACALVDVVQTIADVAGATVPGDWDGDSLAPWLDDAAHPWKDLAVSEYYAHNIASGYVMLRRGAWKYVYHTAAGPAHPAERELYNLDDDPGEFSNLAAAPAQQTRVAELHAALLAELGEDPEATEQRCRADYARGYQRPDPPPASRKK